MKRYLVFIFMMLSVKFIWSEILFLEFRDEKTLEPIVSVNLTVDDKNFIYYSNDNGRLFIKNLKRGMHKLKIRRLGYKNKVLNINFPKQNNLIIKLTPAPKQLHGIVVNQSWADIDTTPVTFENISKDRLENKTLGVDPNILIGNMTNVYSYTETGNDLGYSHLKIRGFDERRIGVMVNGIPLNDPEDHQVYWVDIPDISDNLKNIQLQRGVGNLIYGISSFGGTFNLETQKFNFKNNAELSLMLGSYNTKKISFSVNRNIFSNSNINARFSLLKSDGYRNHSKSDMKSFFLAYSKLGAKSTYNLNFYGGKEITDASWYASSEDELEKNHKHNPKTYPGEIDNFFQPHLEFHHSYFYSDNIKFNNSLFYIYGNGYYKQLKKDKNPWDYSLIEEQNDTLKVDLVRKKSVLKNQAGWIGNINLNGKINKITVGAYLSGYKSRHWGEVDSVSVNFPDFYKGMKYYEYHSKKYYYSFYFQDKIRLFKKINLMLNLQNMNIKYNFKQNPVGNFTGEFLNHYTVDYHFFNPSLGLAYNFSDNFKYYINIAKESREPTDDELYNLWDGPDDIGVQPLFAQSDTIYSYDGEISYIKWGKPYVKPEYLTDFEMGSRLHFGKTNINLNVFHMIFKNEIVPYGGADDEGNPIRGNAEKTIHNGVELSFLTKLPFNFEIEGNFAYNNNYYKKFILHTWDENWNTVTKDYSNKKIAGYPALITKYILSYSVDKFKVSTSVNWFGKQYLDNENLESRIIKPYSLLNAQVIYDVDDIYRLSSLKITLKLNNILNKKFETAGYYDDWEGKNYYWPGAEFNMYLGLKITY